MKTLYLVTGGAGFVGSHLVDRLLADGHAVVCVDNFSTGCRRNLEQHRHNPALQVIEQDITRPLPTAVVEQISQTGLSGIYHLACPASPRHYQTDPIQTTRTAVLGTLNMLDLAQVLAVPLLHASTSEVYGSPEVHPQPEHYWGQVNPIGPRACYDEGKRCAESLCFDYQRHRGVQVKVARIFNTYGPRMQLDDGRVISNFITQALQGQPLTLHGSGSHTRSFCYVDDLIEGLVRLMACSPCPTGPVNLGNPEEISIRTLAEQILTLSDSASTLIETPLPQDDPPRRCPDIGYAKRLLDWQPRIRLQQGLTRTLAEFRQRVGSGLGSVGSVGSVGSGSE